MRSRMRHGRTYFVLLEKTQVTAFEWLGTLTMRPPLNSIANGRHCAHRTSCPEWADKVLEERSKLARREYRARASGGKISVEPPDFSRSTKRE